MSFQSASCLMPTTPTEALNPQKQAWKNSELVVVEPGLKSKGSLQQDSIAQLPWL